MSRPFASTAIPTLPRSLGAQLAHADQLARVVRALQAHAAPDDPSRLWLTGRAEEIEAFVDDVMRDWLAGAVDSVAAGAAIEQYVSSLHAAMEPWYGRWFAPSCCGPSVETEGPRSRVRVRRVRERLCDTVTDETAPSAMLSA
jgi:hypothetical protein